MLRQNVRRIRIKLQSNILHLTDPVVPTYSHNGINIEVLKKCIVQSMQTIIINQWLALWNVVFVNILRSEFWFWFLRFIIVVWKTNFEIFIHFYCIKRQMNSFLSVLLVFVCSNKEINCVYRDYKILISS